MQTTKQSLDQILAAVRTAGYADMIAAVRTETSVIVSILDTEADECLAAIRKHLPTGATAVFSGTSNTDGDGDTTEDIRIDSRSFGRLTRERRHKAAQALGRLGGRAKSPAKAAAARRNGRKGGRTNKSQPTTKTPAS